MPRRRPTLEKFLWGKWMPAIKSTIRTSTYLSYESHLRHHICPYIGSKRLDRIDGAALNELYTHLLTRGRRRGGGLSPATVKRTHAVLHRAFRDATRWGLIDHNPASSADPPKLRAAQQVEFSTWSADELSRFLEFARGDHLYLLWLVLATTGMRRGEAMGLRWCDVDLERGQAAIRQTVVIHNYRISLSEPKTARGRRVVALDEFTVSELTSYKEILQPAEDELLFSYNTRNPLNPIDVSKRFRQMCEEAGLRQIRLHDLRHTHATLALQAGVHPKIVSERLGHSSVSITLDVYSHAIPHMQKEAAAQIAALYMKQLRPSRLDSGDDDRAGS